eukprot:15347316-Ditylum_brightwellii.AAC.1
MADSNKYALLVPNAPRIKSNNHTGKLYDGDWPAGNNLQAHCEGTLANSRGPNYNRGHTGSPDG